MGDVVDKISIPVDTTAAQAAVGFDKLAESMERTAKLQASLNQAQTQSGDLSKLSAYRQEADLLNRTTENNVATFKKLAEVANDNGKAFEGMGRQVQEAGTMFGRLFSNVTGLQQYQGAIDGVSRGVAQLAASIGPSLLSGPVAVGAGALAAIGGLAYIMTSASREADELAAKTLGNARALGTYSDQIKKLRTDASGRISSADADRTNTNKLDSGLGSVADYNVAIAALKDLVKNNDPKVLEQSIRAAYVAADRDTLVKLEEIKHALLTAPGRLSQYEAFRSSAKSDADWRKSNAGALKEYDDAKFLGFPDEPKKAAATHGKTSEQIAEEELGKVAKLDTANADKLIAAVAARNKALETDSIAISNTIASNDLKNEQMRQQEADNTFRLQMQAEEQLFQQKQKHFLLERQERQIINSAIQQTAGIVAGGTAKMLVAVAEGQKVSGAAILKSIGESMIAEGTMAVFSGIIDLASLNPAGAVKVATGAAEIAAGIGFAGAGAAATPSTPATPSSASQAGSSPINNNNSSPGNSGGTTIIYVEMPSVISPTPEDGLRLRQALESADRTYGPAV